MHSDPIADFLTRIRNGQMAGHKVVEIPASNIKKEITKILFDKGGILSYKFVEEGPWWHHQDRPQVSPEDAPSRHHRDAADEQARPADLPRCR